MATAATFAKAAGQSFLSVTDSNRSEITTPLWYWLNLLISLFPRVGQGAPHSEVELPRSVATPATATGTNLGSSSSTAAGVNSCDVAELEEGPRRQDSSVTEEARADRRPLLTRSESEAEYEKPLHLRIADSAVAVGSTIIGCAICLFALLEKSTDKLNENLRVAYGFFVLIGFIDGWSIIIIRYVRAPSENIGHCQLILVIIAIVALASDILIMLFPMVTHQAFILVIGGLVVSVLAFILLYYCTMHN